MYRRGGYVWGRTYVRERGEIFDLVLSWGALTIAFGANSIFRYDPLGLLLAGVAVATAFVFHELAHRWVARKYGLIARYKAWYPGLALAVILALVTAKFLGSAIIFAAPGAVVIVASMGFTGSVAEMYVSAAGPASNILIAYASLVLSHVLPPPYSFWLSYLGRVNSWIAFFNLIPLPPLDGSKVMRYSVTTWGILIALALTAFFII